MAKEVSGGVNVSYQLNSYAFYTKGLTAVISNSMVQIKSTQIEKIFQELNPKTKEEVVQRDLNKLSTDIRKRVLISNHFGTAFKSNNMEEMLFDMKEVQQNYPMLVKQQSFTGSNAAQLIRERSSTPCHDSMGGLICNTAQFMVGVNASQKNFHKNLEQQI